jgi:hypothetical protein
LQTPAQFGQTWQLHQTIEIQHTTSAWVVAESIKIAVSFTLLIKHDGKLPKVENDVLKYAIPAAVYFVNNNLVFVILENIDSTTFQILSRFLSFSNYAIIHSFLLFFTPA